MELIHLPYKPEDKCFVECGTPLSFDNTWVWIIHITIRLRLRMQGHHNLTLYLAYPPTHLPLDPWKQIFCGVGYFVECPPFTTRVWVCDMLCALCVKNSLKNNERPLLLTCMDCFLFVLVSLFPFWTFLHPYPVIYLFGYVYVICLFLAWFLYSG